MKRTPLTAMLTLLAVLASTVAVAGCGGKSGSSTPPNRRRAARRRRRRPRRTAQVQTGLLDGRPTAADARGRARRASALIPTPGARQRGGVADHADRLRGAEHVAGGVERLHGDVARTSAGSVVELSKPVAAIVALRRQRPGAARRRARARTATPVAPFQLACTIVSSPVLLRLARTAGGLSGRPLQGKRKAR